MNSNPLQKFYSQINELKNEINNVDISVENKRKSACAIMSKFSAFIKMQLREFKSSANKHDENRCVELLNGAVENSLASWEKVQKKILETQRFRNEFNDSFLIIIYGKVKAGKSTFVNYLAKHSHCTPEFFIYNNAGKENSVPEYHLLDNDSFEVDDLECTNAVQGFRVPGLTVIDTPGLLSMTPEHGELAKRYIEAADLILYPMASDSPGRTSEIDELIELVKLGKSFCTLITKSDIYEEDEVNGEIVSVVVNKSASNRKEQEEWVEQELNRKLKNALSKLHMNLNGGWIGKIMSISVKMAEDFPINSKEWKESNIPAFFNMMSHIIKENGVRLKIKQPIENIKCHLAAVIGDKNVENYKTLWGIHSNILSEIKKLKQKQTVLKKLTQTVEVECMPEINLEVEEIINNAYINKINSRLTSKKLKQSIKRIITNKLKIHIEEEIKEIAHNFDKSFVIYKEAASYDILEFKEKTKTMEVGNEILTSGAGSAIGGAGGAIVGAELGAMIGSAVPVVGTAIGAILGGLFGGIIGGIGGNEAGKALSGTTTRTITVGDNRNEVESAALKIAQESARTMISEGVCNFENRILKPVIKNLELTKLEVENTINALTKEIEDEKHEK